MLRSCFLSSFIIEFCSEVWEEKLKMSQPIRDQGGHLIFPISLKNKNLVEDVKILLSVKFRWIPLSGFRGEVENVSANQRPGRPSCFRIVPKNTNLVEDVEILLSVKFCKIPFSAFRKEIENVSANQTPGQPSARKTQTWYRTLRSYFLSAFLEFHSEVSEEKSKMSQHIRGHGGHLVFFQSARKTQTW